MEKFDVNIERLIETNDINIIDEEYRSKNKLLKAAMAMKLKKYNPLEVTNLFDLKGNNKNKNIDFLKQYYCYLFQNLVKNRLNNVKMIILVGPPGSGKSTFAYNLLLAYGFETICHVNQDEIGKSECLRLSRDDKRIILVDRCNINSAARTEFINTTCKRSGKIICINFRYGNDTCKQRVIERTNHDMKNPHVVEMVNNQYQQPKIIDGYSEIINVTNEETLIQAYQRFGIKNDTQVKFPRTKHLIYTSKNNHELRDDLFATVDEINGLLKQNIIIDEKIDGANLGIYILNGSITFQNRGKIMLTDPQFDYLPKWYNQHKFEIADILSKGNYIIYGEWMYAKHSIHYDNLPDYYIIFDIYDRDVEKFLSRDRVKNLIKDTTLKLINQISEGFFTINNLLSLVNQKSSYYDGYIEGIYIRHESNGFLISRSKIVRSEFSQSIDVHWTAGQIVKNKVVNF